jgi:hypothetical protein
MVSRKNHCFVIKGPPNAEPGIQFQLSGAPACTKIMNWTPAFAGTTKISSGM